MLFNTISKIAAAAICVASVALAAPAPPSDPRVKNFGAKLEEYAAKAPKWDGTEAGIDSLDGTLWEAANLAGNVRELFATINNSSLPYYGAQFNSVIHNDYEAASAAASALTVKALPAQREKIRDYYHSLMLAIAPILEDAFQRNHLQYLNQANNEFVPIFTKYWDEMNSVPQ